jgi:hypothetical protein
MNTLQSQRHSAPSAFNDFIATDFSALALHMNACQRAGGRLFHVRFLLETLHALAAQRLVTSAALVLACGVALSLLA